MCFGHRRVEWSVTGDSSPYSPVCRFAVRRLVRSEPFGVMDRAPRIVYPKLRQRGPCRHTQSSRGAAVHRVYTDIPSQGPKRMIWLADAGAVGNGTPPA